MPYALRRAPERATPPQGLQPRSRGRRSDAEQSPDVIARHHKRVATLDQLHELLEHLRAAREAKGLSLADLTGMTGMDRFALSKLETGRRGNPTVDALVRYAEAVAKRLVVSLADG